MANMSKEEIPNENISSPNFEIKTEGFSWSKEEVNIELKLKFNLNNRKDLCLFNLNDFLSVIGSEISKEGFKIDLEEGILEDKYDEKYNNVSNDQHIDILLSQIEEITDFKEGIISAGFTSTPEFALNFKKLKEKYCFTSNGEMIKDLIREQVALLKLNPNLFQNTKPSNNSFILNLEEEDSILINALAKFKKKSLNQFIKELLSQDIQSIKDQIDSVC